VVFFGGAEDSMKMRTFLIMAVVLIALGGLYYFIRPRPQSKPATPSRTFIWHFEMNELQSIEVNLPKLKKSQSWVKHQDRNFYFNEPGGQMVDMERWGGGIPLLLSGPLAARSIVEQATDSQLRAYGLHEPNMQINLILENGRSLEIDLGDTTPNQKGYYIRRTDSREVFTVDHSWYKVFERLVMDPPIARSEEE
jgi:hypothetical protein